jgi:hypothetical protein
MNCTARPQRAKDEGNLGGEANAMHSWFRSVTSMTSPAVSEANDTAKSEDDERLCRRNYNHSHLLIVGDTRHRDRSAFIGGLRLGGHMRNNVALDGMTSVVAAAAERMFDLIQRRSGSPNQNQDSEKGRIHRLEERVGDFVAFLSCSVDNQKQMAI